MYAKANLVELLKDLTLVTAAIIGAVLLVEVQFAPSPVTEVPTALLE